MFFSLLICTYKRAQPLLNLLNSVKVQTLYPNEIFVVDGSDDFETAQLNLENTFKNLKYYKVSPKDRGLTKQRNFGIDLVSKNTKVVCFLDDDTELELQYFENLIALFANNSTVTGVGGVSINENIWLKNTDGKKQSKDFFVWENYYIKEALRNKVRNYLGLQSDLAPNKMPEFGHGRSCGYPLTDKFYEVDLLIGMSMSFRYEVVKNIRFSTYFEGYGLYEDADFSIRALQFGSNVIATNVQLSHFHDASGRPNLYNYGKMVVRNGYYVWRIKYPNPNFKAKIKWHLITLLLTFIRFSNVFTTHQKKQALMESLGRLLAWFSLFVKPPKLPKHDG